MISLFSRLFSRFDRSFSFFVAVSLLFLGLFEDVFKIINNKFSFAHFYWALLSLTGKFGMRERTHFSAWNERARNNSIGRTTDKSKRAFDWTTDGPISVRVMNGSASHTFINNFVRYFYHMYLYFHALYWIFISYLGLLYIYYTYVYKNYIVLFVCFFFPIIGNELKDGFAGWLNSWHRMSSPRSQGVLFYWSLIPSLFIAMPFFLFSLFVFWALRFVERASGGDKSVKESIPLHTHAPWSCTSILNPVKLSKI